eukprot:Tbor_TRINITY_DN4488_c0_g3::TRINITY_DN4488_c0_g3_i1::g.8100::m.8100/K01519/ITPA; inosine triphosphate pyrophosphatase
MTIPRRITLITGNANKVREIEAILYNDPKCVSLDGKRDGVSTEIKVMKLDLPEIQEICPKKIAKAKALEAFRIVKEPVLIEDTSLYYKPMNGLPGPLIKWFLQSIGREGIYKMTRGFSEDPKQNSEKADTNEPTTTGPFDSVSNAYACCIFTLCISETEIHYFEGRIDGNIVSPRVGSDFGWDPIFQPYEPGVFDFSGRTFAEMTSDEKNAVSHRRRGLEKLKKFLESGSRE